MEVAIDLNLDVISVEGGEIQFGKKEVTKEVKLTKSSKKPTVTFKAKVLGIADTTNSYITINNFYSQNDSIGVIVKITDSSLSVPRTTAVPLIGIESDMSDSMLDKVEEALKDKYGIKEDMGFTFTVEHNVFEVDDSITGDDILDSIKKLKLNNAIRSALLGQPRKMKEKDLFKTVE